MVFRCKELAKTGLELSETGLELNETGLELSGTGSAPIIRTKEV